MNPLIFAFGILIFNLISLIIPAAKLKSTDKLFKNPAFLIGDFFILPLISFLIIYFSAGIEFNPIVLILSTIITLAFGVHFKLIKVYWIPHGIFHVTFVYLVLSFLIVAFRRGDFLEGAVVLILVAVHYLLGALYPKKL